MMKLFISFAD